MPPYRTILGSLLICLVIGLWAFGCYHFKHLFGIFGFFPIAPFAEYLLLSYAALAGSYVLLGRDTRSRRTRMLRMSILTASSVLCVVTLELPAALQLIDYRAFLGYGEDWDPLHNRVDPEVITIHRPNTGMQGRFSGAYVHMLGVQTDRSYEVDVRWDRNGFRNVEHLEKADLVIVGDSFVESPLVALEEIASTRLARELGVAVLNLGQSGYGAEQELIVLKRLGLPARPNVVVWMLYEGNDFGDYVAYHKIKAQGVGQWAANQETFWKRSFSRSLLTWVAQRTRQGAVWNALGARLYGTLTPSGPWQGGNMYFSHNRQLSPTDHPEAVEGTKACIRKAHETCAAKGIEFLLVFAPEQFRVYHDLLQANSSSQISGWRINDLPNRFRDWARGEGIAYVDLTPALHRAAAAGTLVYFLDDPHWTAEGNAVVGETLAAYCKQHLRLTKGSLPVRSPN